MSNHIKSKDSLENITKNFECVRNILRDYLKTKEMKEKGWMPVKMGELAAICYTEGLYFATNNSGGKNGKEPYAWLSILYKGIACAIGTVWENADIDTCNIHHYFGQICFIKNTMQNADKCSSPNTPDTTVKDIYDRGKEFQDFLNKFEYKTVRESGLNKKSFTQLTVDNFLDENNDKVNAEKVIELFECWASQYVGKND